jgi:hypothetical protein
MFTSSTYIPEMPIKETINLSVETIQFAKLSNGYLCSIRRPKSGGGRL